MVALTRCSRPTLADKMAYFETAPNTMRVDPSSEVRFSPDGKEVITAARGRVQVWDATTGKLRRDFSAEVRFRSAFLSRDARLLLACPERESTALLHDAVTGKVLRRISNPGGEVTALALSPDGTKVALGGMDKTIRVFEAKTGKLIHTLRGHEYPLESFDFSPDGILLASADSVYWRDNVKEELLPHIFRVWNLASGKVIWQASYDSAAGAILRFDPSGQCLTRSTEELCRYDVASGKELGLLGQKGIPCFGPSWTRDGSRVTVHSTRGAEIWQSTPCKKLLVMDQSTGVRKVAFSPDGRRIAGVCSEGDWVAPRFSLRLWDAQTGKRLPIPAGPREPMRSMALAADGTTLATGSSDGPIHLWDLRNGKEQAVLQGHTGSVVQLVFSPDGKLLASAALRRRFGPADSTVRLWRLSDGKQLQVLGPYIGGASTLAFSPDGKTLAVGAHKQVAFFAVPSGTKVSLLPSPPRSAHQFAFSPDGRTLAVSDDFRSPLHGDVLHLFDLKTGKLLADESNGVDNFKIEYTPDSRWLIALQRGGLVRLLDGRSGREKAQLEVGKPRSGTPRARIRAQQGASLLCCSPDGQLLAVAGGDETVRVYEIAMRQEVLALQGHSDKVAQVLFSLDGNRLISRGEDQTVLVWDLLRPPGSHLASTEAGTDRIKQLWKLLEKPTEDGFRATRLLIREPEETVRYLRRHLEPVAARDTRRILRLVAQLDSDRREEREAASRELAALAELAAPELEAATAKPASAEAARRARVLLEALGREALSPPALQERRAVGVLEQIGSPAARELLTKLAAGEPLAPLTRCAKEAVQRLERNSGSR
jgi:WD40 repeat protein